MEKTKKDRLYKVMDALNLTDYRVYKDVPNITKNMMIKLRNGETKDASSRILEPFCKYYKNVNPNYLLTGEGKMLLDDADTPQISYTKGKPYYDVDLLGGFDVIINDQTTVPSYLIDFKKYDDADCWCNITGHSMEPLISHGDIIAIKEMKEWREFILFGELYGIITNDMRTVKIVTRSTLGNEFLQLVPANKSEEYQPQDIPVKLITHVFKILGCMKKL